MRVPIRKAGRYTKIKPDPRMTRGKFEELSKKLENMKKDRPILASEVKRLGENGDFSENAEYQIAKARLRALNEKITDTSSLLASSVIIESAKDSRKVLIGSLVKMEKDGRPLKYRILGSLEADPKKGIISTHSPIGSALLGREQGEEFTENIAGRVVEFKIIKIE